MKKRIRIKRDRLWETYCKLDHEYEVLLFEDMGREEKKNTKLLMKLNKQKIHILEEIEQANDQMDEKKGEL